MAADDSQKEGLRMLADWSKWLVAVQNGEMTILPDTDPEVLAFSRTAGNQQITFPLNMGAIEKAFVISTGEQSRLQVLAGATRQLIHSNKTEQIILTPVSTWIAVARN